MKKKNGNELLFVLYIFLFIIIKFFFKFDPTHTFIMLLVPSIIILLSSFIYNGRKSVVLKPHILFISIIVFIPFLLTIIFNNNSYVMNYLYEFIIYGLIPMYLFSRVKDINEVINIGGKFSIISFLLFFYDPLRNYYYFSDYMSFGLVCMLPIFLFSILSRKRLGKKKFFILEMLSLFEMLIFCNRGSFLTAIIIEIVFFIIEDNKEKNKYLFFKIISLIAAAFILIANVNNILLIIQKVLTSLNFNSYSIRAVSLMISGNSSGLSGRENIWANAISYFWDSPIFGHGIGSFENIYGIYTHNLILETLTSTGIIGLIVILISFIKCIKKIIIGENKSFYFALLIIGIFPLLFSIYIYKWLFFWILIYIAYDKPFKKERK